MTHLCVLPMNPFVMFDTELNRRVLHMETSKELDQPVEMYGLYGVYGQTLKTPLHPLTEWKLCSASQPSLLWQMVLIQKQRIKVFIMTQTRDNLSPSHVPDHSGPQEAKKHTIP